MLQFNVIFYTAYRAYMLAWKYSPSIAFYYLIVWVHFCFLKIYIYLYVQNVVYTYTYHKKMYIKYVFFLLISKKKKIFLFVFGNDFCLACFSLRNDVHTTHCSFRFRRFSFIILCATDLTIWVDGSSYKHAYHYIVMPGGKKSNRLYTQKRTE